MGNTQSSPTTVTATGEKCYYMSGPNPERDKIYNDCVGYGEMHYDVAGCDLGYSEAECLKCVDLGSQEYDDLSSLCRSVNSGISRIEDDSRCPQFQVRFNCKDPNTIIGERGVRCQRITPNPTNTNNNSKNMIEAHCGAYGLGTKEVSEGCPNGFAHVRCTTPRGFSEPDIRGRYIGDIREVALEQAVNQTAIVTYANSRIDEWLNGGGTLVDLIETNPAETIVYDYKQTLQENFVSITESWMMYVVMFIILLLIVAIIVVIKNSNRAESPINT